MSALIDLEIVSSGDDEVHARVPVTDACKQPLGLVHGGVYAMIADALTGASGRVDLQPDELPAARHRRDDPRRSRGAGTAGRTTAVWEVDLADDAGPAVRAGQDDDPVPDPDTPR